MSGELIHPISVSVRNNLEESGISTVSKILVGVSGGVDSMVLLYILYKNGYNVAAAHVNFNLRGAESINDAQFVKSWCLDLGIPYNELSKDTKTYAIENQLNTQTAARNIRYEWWEYLVHAHQFDYVATAHHLDDNIETMFLNLLRGTGIKGLKGIPPVRGKYIRPLLDTKRSAIESFAAEFEIPFSTDQSNQSDQYQRNRLRHHLIPMLEELYPGFQSSMKHTLHRINMEWTSWAYGYETWIAENIRVDQDGFRIHLRYQDMAYILRWLEEKGFPWLLAHDFLKAPKADSGNMLRYETYTLSRTTEGYYLEEKQPAFHSMLPKEGRYNFGHFELVIENVPATAFSTSDGPWTAYVNEDVISWPLHLRNVSPGDSFQPLGMQGRHKKIQDLMVDAKLELFEKERLLLLTNNDHILWVTGLRLDERAKIRTSDKRIYRVTYLRIGKD